MGHTISHIIRSVSGGEEKRREAEDVLNTLIAVAEDKARIHHWKVAKTPIDRDVLPIEKVVRKVHMVHCGVERDYGPVRAVLRHCMGREVKGEIVEGLTAVTLQTLEKLLEIMDGKKSSETSSYSVLLGEKGQIGRLDCYMFYYRFGSPTIAEVAEDCLITSLVFSQADVAKISASNVPFLVQPTYSVPLPGEKPQKTLERMDTIERAVLKAVEHGPRHRSLPKTLPSIEQVLTGIGGNSGQKVAC